MTLLLFLLLAVSMQQTLAMEKPLYVNHYNDNKKQIASYVNRHTLLPEHENILGYNPNITFLADSTPGMVHQRVNVWMHGFGGSQNCAANIKQVNPQQIPGDTVTFNFPDSHLANNILAIKKTSLGQSTEIIPTIYTLNYLSECKEIDALDCDSISRACCTLINTLATLHRPSNTLDKELQRLFIDSLARQRILDKIKKGILTLWWPLRNVDDVIENQINSITQNSCDSLTSSVSSFWPSKGLLSYNPLNFLIEPYLIEPLMPSLKNALNFSASIVKASSNASVQYCSMPIVSSYRPWNETVKKSLAILQDCKDFKCILFPQPDDTIVSNLHEGDYYNSLPCQEEHKYVVPGTTGGHVRADKHQITALNAYKKRYNGSYYNNNELLRTGKKILKKAQPDNASDYLTAYYALNKNGKKHFWNVD